MKQIVEEEGQKHFFGMSEIFNRQCLTTRTRHKTKRYWRTGHHQEPRLIKKYKKYIFETWLKILIRRRLYLHYANDFMGF